MDRETIQSEKENGDSALCEGVEVSEGVARAYSFQGKQRVCVEILRDIMLGDLGSTSSRLSFCLREPDISEQGDKLMARDFSKTNLLAIVEWHIITIGRIATTF